MHNNSVGAISMQDPGFMRKIVDKLPFYMQDRWRRLVDGVIYTQSRMVKFEDLVGFIDDEVRILMNPYFGKQTSFDSGKNVTNKNVKSVKGNVVTSNATGNKLSCWMCSGPHILDNCDELRKIPVNDRFNIIKEKKLCYGCLRGGHMAKDCTSRKKCDICGSMHPTLLHKDPEVYQDPNLHEVAVSHKINIVERVNLYASRMGGNNVDVTIVPIRVKHNGKEVITHAFLDNGSTGSFCSSRLIEKLGLEIGSLSSVMLTLSTINGESTSNTPLVPGVTVSSLDGNNPIDLPPLYVINEIPVEASGSITKSDLDKWDHLRNLDLPVIDCTHVDLMIGTNAPQVHEPWEIRNSTGKNVPYAEKTKLGWVVKGFKKESSNFVSVHRVNIKHGLKLDQELIKSFNRDFEDLASDKKELSDADKLWLEKVNLGCRRTLGKYEIPLIIKDIDTLPESRKTALKRLHTLKHKLKDETFKEKYITFMESMFENNYAEAVPAEEMDKEDSWYIPHFGVQHPEKLEKVRVVFDCAARVGGVAFNDIIDQGPDLLNKLLGVLLRFRVGLYAYSADIEAMFYQVRVPLRQRDYLRFFWWENNEFSGPIKMYRMCVHIFGASSSPSISNFALKKVAQDFGKQFDEDVANTVLSAFYVDDLLVSKNTLEEIIENANKVRDICKLGGFNLTKYISNDKEFLSTFDVQSLGKKMDSYISGEAVVCKVLGVYWNLSNDMFGPEVDISSVPDTKRKLLSMIASIYDPLGIASPLILEGRAIMQELCRLHVGWDECLEASIYFRTKNWVSHLKEIETCKINRCVLPFPAETVHSIEMHIFCDASLLAYGAVAYLRSLSSNQISCRFLMGKSRIGPLKSVSVPRLELSSATLAVKLFKTLQEELNLSLSSVRFWTDSTTVLRYISNTSLRFQTFVANRVAMIREVSRPQQWLYVPGEHNPADDVSRAKQSSRWVNGPAFLLKPTSEWPSQPFISDNFDGLEIKHSKQVFQTNDVPEPMTRLIEHYSSFYRLLKAAAWVMLYIEFKTAKSFSNEKKLNMSLLKLAETRLIIYVQKLFYHDEMFALNKGQQIKMSSHLSNLRPILGDGLLRVGGRLKHSSLDFNTKYPIILPYRSHITDLIIEHFHSINGHTGRMHTLAQIRVKYWIIKGNAAVRRILSKCVRCRQYRSKPIEQEMSNLPSCRITTVNAPFTNTGVDCFGPFIVKRGRSSIKRYGVIFTCMSIRAVHLEIAADLSTGSFINCLRRFSSRRGKVETLFSDQGTNFVGAKRELSDNFNKICQDSRDQLLFRGMQWVFNPPGASHFGGSWERMIGVVRDILQNLLGSQTIDDDNLHTIFCEVETIINSRPLTVVSSDPNDILPLTPNNLLNVGSVPVPMDVGEAESYSVKRWKQVQYVSDIFWKRWSREYLTCLQKREKWLKKSRDVNINDIVLIVDETLPRCHWPLGRVIEVHKSADGLIRKVTVRRGSKQYDRPISKLILLLEGDR